MLEFVNIFLNLSAVASTLLGLVSLEAVHCFFNPSNKSDAEARIRQIPTKNETSNLTTQNLSTVKMYYILNIRSGTVSTISRVLNLFMGAGSACRFTKVGLCLSKKWVSTYKMWELSGLAQQNIRCFCSE